ncbi:MAG: cytochrome b5 domain-containing protein [Xanthomonadaceae bacterium]|nr:cytochrome b5 domain-containing protein [Xanthomonadaceae bacterium]
MKKLTWSAFVAFWASVVTLLVVGALAPPQSAHAEPPNRVVTLEELAAHATAGDCWMAIRGKVYDFSAYIPQHPTPPSVMTQWCGREATEAYDTKGYGRPHSAAADGMMDQYLVGVLVQQD